MGLFLIFLLIISVNSTLSFIAAVVEESVKGGSYVYFNLSVPEDVYLHLRSTTGDCDLYVSLDEVFPTFTNFSYHSATCGDDNVFVSKKLNRSVYIGVYGHPSHEESNCIMDVCLVETPDGQKNDYNDLLSLPDSVVQESCLKESAPKTSRLYIGLGVIFEMVTDLLFDSTMLDLLGVMLGAII